MTQALLLDRLVWDRRCPPLSLAVPPGERLYVCGGGAEAVLRTVGGFIPQAAGRIACDGRDLTGQPAPARHLAYVPAGDSLVPRRSLLGNVMLAGVSRAAAAAAIAALGLDPAARTAALSVAERRLAALARALAAQPSLLLVEQGAADPPAIPDALAARPGVAALVAAQDPPLALARADRILLLHDGAAIQLAAPRDLYERPADADAAGWSGPCNLIPAMLDGPGPVPGSVRARIGRHLAAARFRDRTDGPVRLAVRPHALRPDPAGLPARPIAAEYLGAITRLRLRLDQTLLLCDLTQPPQPLPAELRLGWDWTEAWPVGP